MFGFFSVVDRIKKTLMRGGCVKNKTKTAN